MRTYYIYNYQTDEFLGEIKADNVLQAEIKASGIFNIDSEDIYAFTKKF